MAHKIFRFRQNLTIKLKDGSIINEEGPWHLVYVDEELAKERMEESKVVHTSFKSAYNDSSLWYHINRGTTYFRKRPYLNVWNTWGGYRIYEKQFKSATWFSEYEEAPKSVTIDDLVKELPAKHFMEFCADNSVHNFIKNWSGNLETEDV